MNKTLKRYRITGIILLINSLLLLFKPSLGAASIAITVQSLKEMLLIMPPIFILLGLFDVWLQRETMMKFMGEKSGLVGVVIAFLLGSIAAGPLYVAFPFAAVLIKKGTNFFNLIIFLGAWSATKIPISLFEASVMGWKFMLYRYILDIFVILLIAYIVNVTIPAKEKAAIYEKAETLT